jgi:hypothetical protein
VSRRFERRCLIERTDMEVHFGRTFAFARQSGAACRTEPAPSARRRIELRDLAFCDLICVTPECHKYGYGRTAMFTTALTMAPRYPYRFASGYKSHRAAQAAALNLIAHSYPFLAGNPRSPLLFRRTAIRLPPQRGNRLPSILESRHRTGVH